MSKVDMWKQREKEAEKAAARERPTSSHPGAGEGFMNLIKDAFTITKAEDERVKKGSLKPTSHPPSASGARSRHVSNASGQFPPPSPREKRMSLSRTMVVERVTRPEAIEPTFVRPKNNSLSNSLKPLSVPASPRPGDPKTPKANSPPAPKVPSDKEKILVNGAPSWHGVDAGFESDPHQIAQLILEGKLDGLEPEAILCLEKCSSEQLFRYIPVVACCVASVPYHSRKSADKLVQVLLKRSREDPRLGLALGAISSCGFLRKHTGYTKWVPDPKDLPDQALLKAFMDLLKNEKGYETGYTHPVASHPPAFFPFGTSPAIKELVVERVFNSNARPLLLSVVCQGDKGKVDRKIILKQGDDLRQDVAVLRLFAIFNLIWAKELDKSSPVQALTYDCLAMKEDVGCIQYVPGCVSLSKIKEYTFSHDCQDRMVATAAGAYMAAYILGVRDRHHDNILISQEDGSVFHIDFGSILGEKVSLDTSSFAITKELQQAMGERWMDFVTRCIMAHRALRKHQEEILGLAEVLLAPFGDSTTIFDFVRDHLLLDLSDEDAMARLKEKIEVAPTKFNTRLKNAVHTVAVSLKSPSSSGSN